MYFSNLSVGAMNQDGYEAIITDSNLSVVLPYPYPSFIKVVASSGLTQSSRVSLLFTGNPPSGSELTVAVVQPTDLGAASTGKILGLNLNIAGTISAPGFSFQPYTDSSNASPTPHPGCITIFKYQFVDGYYYVKYGEGEAFYSPSSFAYQWVDKNYSEPQKSVDVFKDTWIPNYYLGASFDCSNPVYIHKTSGIWSNGVVVWAMASGGTEYMCAMTPDGSVTRTVIAFSGTPLRMVARETESTATTAAVYLTTSSNTYRISLDLSSVQISYSPTSIDTIASGTGALIYPDKFLDNVYYGDGTDLMRQGASGALPVAVNTTLGSAIVEICRSLDGDLFVIGSGGHYKIATDGFGVGPSWGISSSFAFSATVRSASWDALNKRWLVFCSNGDLYHSTNINASAWVLLASTGQSSSDFLTRVGHVHVLTATGGSGVGFASFSVDGGANWKYFQPFSSNTYCSRGFCYFNGRLVTTLSHGTSTDPMVFISAKNCNRWGPLDTDK